MTFHTSLSPSKAAMWLNCSKSIVANEGEEDLGDPAFRRLGTAMHEFREKALLRGVEAFDLVGETVFVDGEEFELDDEQAFALQGGIDRIRAFGGQLFTEQRVDLSPWLGEGQSGTMDTGVVLPDLIVVSDYKNGFALVAVESNEQLMLYALGFWHSIARHQTNAKKFLLMIDQPNAFGGGIKEWEVSLEELLAFGERARVAAQKTVDPNAHGTPSPSACRWCKAKAKCGDIAEYLLNLFGLKMSDFDDDLIGCGPELPKFDDLTPEQRIAIINHGSMIKQWLEAVSYRTLMDALRGEPTPGKKAVYGKPGNRKFRNEDVAKTTVLEFFPPEKVLSTKLKTPAQLEKAIGVKAFQNLEGLISRADPKPVLVDASDRREAIPPENVADMFDELDAD